MNEDWSNPSVDRDRELSNVVLPILLVGFLAFFGVLKLLGWDLPGEPTALAKIDLTQVKKGESAIHDHPQQGVLVSGVWRVPPKHADMLSATRGN